jgi:Recombination directionality factor-like
MSTDNELASHKESAIHTYQEETVHLLDPRSETGLTKYEPGLRMWAATVSAGWKNPQGIPQVSRDGKIILHEDMGDAPGIKAALEATGYRSITITMLSDGIGDCLKQLFCSYDTTKIFGDHTALTVMRMEGDKQVRKVIKNGEPGWKEMLAKTKPCTFVPFALAEWDENDLAAISFVDGFVPYRLRFGSNNSIRAFVEALQAIKRITGGKLIGVPLNLSIAYKTVMCPDLCRRSVPVWNPVLKHPKGLRLGAAQIQGILTAGIKDAEQLALPEPIRLDDEEVLDAIIKTEQQDAVDEESGEVTSAQTDAAITHADMRIITEAEVPEQRRLDYFRNMQNTPYVHDEARAILVQRCANIAGLHLSEPSLRELVFAANAEEWRICEEVMCKAAAGFHGTDAPEKSAKAVVSEEDPYADSAQTGTTQAAAATVETKPVEEPKTEPTPAQTEGTAKEAEPAKTPDPVKEPEQSAAAAKPAPKKREPTPVADQPKIPVVKNYLVLERDPTESEKAVAEIYGRDHLSQEQFIDFGRLCGGINVYMGLLQARQAGAENFGDIMRAVDPDWKEIGAQEGLPLE